MGTNKVRKCAARKITINVPVVGHLVLMILMRANPLLGSLNRAGPENLDFLGPEMAMSKASAIWDQKSLDFQGPSLPMALVMDAAHIKIIMSRAT